MKKTTSVPSAAHSLSAQSSSAPESRADRRASQRSAAGNAEATSRHTRKCSICNHPDREAIESDFINWRSEEIICYEFHLGSRSSIYRHAAATGLLARRRRNLRGVCERIIERVADAPPSAAAVLRALRVLTRITEDGQWAETPRHSVITHVHINGGEAKTAAGASAPAAGSAARSQGPVDDFLPPSESCPSEPVALPPLDAAQESALASDGTVPADENAPNSSEPSEPFFPGEIAINTRWNRRLTWRNAPEILIGTQNDSPENLTDGEIST